MKSLKTLTYLYKKNLKNTILKISHLYIKLLLWEVLFLFWITLFSLLKKKILQCLNSIFIVTKGITRNWFQAELKWPFTPFKEEGKGETVASFMESKSRIYPGWAAKLQFLNPGDSEQSQKPLREEIILHFKYLWLASRGWD